MRVSVVEAIAEEAFIFNNLGELYVHDFAIRSSFVVSDDPGEPVPDKLQDQIERIRQERPHPGSPCSIAKDPERFYLRGPLRGFPGFANP